MSGRDHLTLLVGVRRKRIFLMQEGFDDEARRHEKRARLEHQIGSFLVEITPVLDRAAPGAKRRHDAGLPVTVSSHDALGATGLSDDRSELLVGELLVHGMIDFRHHAARSTHLDELCVAAQVRAHGLQHLRHPVAQIAESSGA